MKKGEAPKRTGSKKPRGKARFGVQRDEPQLASSGGGWFRSIPDWIKAIVALIGALLAVGHYLFTCDRRALTLALGIVGYVGLLTLLLLLALGRRPIFRMSLWMRRKIAIMGLWILVLLNAAGAMVLAKRNNEVCNRVAVLMTKFDERDPTAYRVNDKIIDQLRRTLGEFDDTVLLTVSDVVTTVEGPDRAWLLGECHCAKLVFWGYCAVNPGGVEVTVHVEDRTRLGPLPLLRRELLVDKGTIEDLNSFQFQARFNEELSAFVLFLSGFIRYEAKDYHGAIKHFTSANFGWDEEWIAKAHLFFYRGNAHFFQGDLEQAKADYLQAIVGYSKQEKDKVQLATAYYNLGVANMSLGHPELAKDDYAKAIEINDGLAEAHNNLGYLLNAEGKYTEALASYSRAIEINDHYAEAYNNRAVVLAALNRDNGDIEQAINDCTRSLDINPRYAEAFYNRGNAYAALGDKKSRDGDAEATKDYLMAIEDYSEAVRLNEDYVEAYNNRADTLNTLGRSAEAIRDCTRALDIRPQYADAYLTRSVARAALGQLEDAKADLRKTLDLCKEPRVCKEAATRLSDIEGKTP